MKTTITKTLILLMCGMLSFLTADAQDCDCFCTPSGKPRKDALCYTKPNGDPGCQKFFCNHRLGFEQYVETSSLLIYPNPVSTATIVSFYIESTENVSIKIFDVNGRLVTTLINDSFEEGDHEIILNAHDVNAGIYFLRLETATYSENQKLIVAK